ncbi:hypothetical protein AUR04nite_34600 [Glutamicibacter uratoxydans]|uniref:Uncharacterized protein n=1 Tax=Glutamicibacter uratoxydans TaxID=43667 RepID=A0A4Y4DX24_GLUUR|nr:hypothetical protein AUR04nite_34600 [Glutamicibacter uratoxydans]
MVIFNETVLLSQESHEKYSREPDPLRLDRRGFLSTPLGQRIPSNSHCSPESRRLWTDYIAIDHRISDAPNRWYGNSKDSTSPTC